MQCYLYHAARTVERVLSVRWYSSAEWRELLNLDRLKLPRLSDEFGPTADTEPALDFSLAIDIDVHEIMLMFCWDGIHLEILPQ